MHGEIMKYWTAYKMQKSSYSVFYSRIKRYWCSFSEAIKPTYLHLRWVTITTKGRTCNKCKQYKQFHEFCKDKSQVHGYSYDCIQCRKNKRLLGGK